MRGRAINPSNLISDDLEQLKEIWRHIYQIELPAHAKQNNWPVHHDHCVARIIYDHVAKDRWDKIWNKPAIHHLNEQQLKACIRTAQNLESGQLNINLLNKQSLIYRGKIYN